MSDHHDNHNPEPGWADSPAFVRWFSIGLYIACIGAGAAGFVDDWKNPKPHFPAEEFPVFFAFYGFLMFFGIVMIGKHLRKLLSRDENYYEERE